MGRRPLRGCGKEFSIGQHPAFSSLIVAEHQAHWLERVPADEPWSQEKTSRSDRTAGVTFGQR